MPQFDVNEAVRLIEQERIAFLPGPPTIFQMLLAEKERADFDSSSRRAVPMPLAHRITTRARARCSSPARVM